MKSPTDTINRLKFYREVAQSGIEYTPPAQFFADTEEVITALIKEVNTLRAETTRDNNHHHNEEKS